MRKWMLKIVFIVSLMISATGIFAFYMMYNMQIYNVKSYVAGIEIVNHKEYDIHWDNKNDEYNIVSETGEFKVMQLTDLHIGGTRKTEQQDIKAFKAVYKLVKYAEPDLIIVTGDLIYPDLKTTHSPDNMKSFTLLCDFFENMGVPWTFTFGNHDTEGFALAGPEDINHVTQTYLKCLYQYRDPLGGRTNLFINVRDKENRILQSLVLMDSREYVEGGYDSISEEQLEWYERRILKLSEEQGKQVPSMLFFHIPFQEWNMIYDMYKKKSPEVRYHYGRIGEKNEEICSSKENNSLLDKLFKLGSTKAVFVGHDHLNDLSLEYRGVRFTYGKSIDYLAYNGIESSTYQRGATLIKIRKNSEFEILPIVLSELA